MYYMPKTIRGIDDETFREFKAKAQKEDRTIGEAITEAMSQWLDKTDEKIPLDEMDAFDWGEDAEKLSKEYEEELYGKTA
jgi:phenylpyruvate tautomerase PptA (4-oxalocrotonate tautomerase family)